MFLNKVIILATTMVAAPIAGSALVVGAAAPAQGQAKPSVSPSLAPPLSAPAQGVLKLFNSGTSEDVIKAYIDNSTTAFNLTPENVIDLQKSGVSSTVLSSMLTHDKKLRDQARAAAQSAETNYPAVPPLQSAPTQVDPQTALPSDEEVYYNLEPYGNWNYVSGYGWGWQPYATISYSSYPWGWLGYGYWSSLPNRGWCWFPRSHFRSFERHYGSLGPRAFGRLYGYDRFNRGYYNSYYGGYNRYDGDRNWGDRRRGNVYPVRPGTRPDDYTIAPGYRQGRGAQRGFIPVNPARQPNDAFTIAPGYRNGRAQRFEGNTMNATRPGFNGPPATQFTTPFQSSGYRASAGGFIQTGNGNAGAPAPRVAAPSAFRNGGPVGSFRGGGGGGGFRGGGGGGARGGGGR